MGLFIYKSGIRFRMLGLAAIMGVTSINAQVYSSFSSPSSGTHYSVSVSGICLGCGVTNPSYAATLSLQDSTHIYMTVGALNSITLRLKLTDSAQAYAGVMLKSNTGLLNLSALDAVTLKTYKAGVLQETFNGSSVLSLELLSPDYQLAGVAVNKSFDEIQFEIDNTLSALWDINIFYAFGLDFVPLPENWLYFKAELLKSKDMKISWATNAEVACRGYYIQHSTDGKIFEDIGFVPGHGTYSDISTYNFLHMAPALGTHYYQVLAEDMNGNRISSDKIKKEVVFNEKYETFARIQPNPVAAEFVFEANKPFKILEVCNSLGQVVYKQQYNNSHSATINIEALSSGFYYIRAEGEGMSKMLRFMKN